MRHLPVLSRSIMETLKTRDMKHSYIADVLSNHLPDGHRLIAGNNTIYYETEVRPKLNFSTEICSIDTHLYNDLRSYFVIHNVLPHRFKDMKKLENPVFNYSRTSIPPYPLGYRFVLSDDHTFNLDAIHQMLKLIKIFNDKRVQNQKTVAYLKDNLVFDDNENPSPMILNQAGLNKDNFTIQVRINTEFSLVSFILFNIYPTHGAGYNKLSIPFGNKIEVIDKISTTDLCNALKEIALIKHEIGDYFSYLIKSKSIYDLTPWYQNLVKHICMKNNTNY